jgi:hypothetical protein
MLILSFFLGVQVSRYAQYDELVIGPGHKNIGSMLQWTDKTTGGKTQELFRLTETESWLEPLVYRMMGPREAVLV